ncbi:hypothetical protein roselon_03599 [Roseibacterium elongatum DSM 19469]|uniref:Uncharacterized protein n=1 Tax=Roseicyclus elongatus DSM 19469 TaxID=1294273 RepID=W8RXA2_9RHOB|nr:hypothetical protein roselon_03599 [Roseibacterium elongatum DSM 19469]
MPTAASFCAPAKRDVDQPRPARDRVLPRRAALTGSVPSAMGDAGPDRWQPRTRRA